MLIYMKERAIAEQAGLHRVEDIEGDLLTSRFEEILQTLPDGDALMVDAVLVVDDMKAGRDPDFSWVPDQVRVEILSAWSESRDRIQEFKEDEARARREAAEGHREDVLTEQLKETAETSAKLSEIESEIEKKFGKIPDKIPERLRHTEIIKPRQPQKSAMRRFFDRLAGNE